MNMKNYISVIDVAENARLNFELDKWFWMPYRKGFALRGMTVLFLLACFPSSSQAETCTPTPDCKSLGYTQSSCPEGKGVKCPWNTSLWHCDQGKKCSDLGFSRSCTGTGYAGGEGMACDGKYAYCKCSSGYIWKDGSCIQPACLERVEAEAYVERIFFDSCAADGSSYTPICKALTKGCGTVKFRFASSHGPYDSCMATGPSYCNTQSVPGLISCDICKKYDF